MLTRRILPRLDVKDGRVVKGVRFEALRDAGDPVQAARAYGAAGADELCFLDISASLESRGTLVELVESVARQLAIPFAVGGGVRNAGDAETLLRAGADKVSVNTAALANPALITEGARRAASRCGGPYDSGRREVRRARPRAGRGAGRALRRSADAGVDEPREPFAHALDGQGDLLEPQPEPALGQG